jgi:hypothetical protein
MRNRFLFALTGALIAIVAISGIALATPSAGVTSTTIATGRLGEVDLKVKTGPWKGSRTSRSSRTAWRPAGRSAGTATPGRASSSSSRGR